MNFARSAKNIYDAAKASAAGNERLIFAGKILITVGLSAYIIYRLNTVELVDLLTRADYLPVAAALLLLIPNIVLQYAKWSRISGSVLHIRNRAAVVRSLFYGFAGGAFTPARAGEYIGRRLAFGDISLLEVTAATLIDKLFSFLVIVFSGAASAVLFIHLFLGAGIFISVSLFLLLFALLLLTLFLVLSEEFWGGLLYKRLTSIKFIASYAERLSILKQLDRKTLALLLLLSTAFYFCFLIQYALLLTAFVEVPFTSALWAGALMFLAKTMAPPVTLGEFGIREAASAYFVTFFALPAAAGFNAALLLFLINVALPSAAGAVLMFTRKR